MSRLKKNFEQVYREGGDIVSQRCDECKHYREANAYVFDGEKSYCAKGYDIGLTQLNYSMNNKKCKDYKFIYSYMEK